jgi:hypothetical protein
MKTELEIRGGRVLIILKLAELTEESSRWVFNPVETIWGKENKALA